MKLYWIYGTYAEDFWITTAEDMDELFNKYSQEFKVSVDWARENCTFSEINKIDNYEIVLKKIVNKSDQLAYEHYLALCTGKNMKPLSFESWKTLVNGEVPKEFIQ